jgi:hypothetical protein
MSKVHRRCCLALSMIVVASALLAVSPAGAFAAGEEFSDGSANSSPTSAEWTPQPGQGATGSEGSSFEHGSSVGSGGVGGEKTGSSGEESSPPPPQPSYTPDSSSSREPAPTVGPTADAAPSAPRVVEHRTQPEQPAVAAKPDRTGSAVAGAVGAAVPLSHPESPQVDNASAPPAVPPRADSGDQAASGSSPALPLLAVIVVGLILGFAFVRLKRHRERRRLEALWHQQDVAWEAALRRAGPGEAPAISTPSAKRKPSPQPLPQIKVG